LIVHPLAIIIIKAERVISDSIWQMILTISKNGMPMPFDEYMRRWITFQNILANYKNKERIMIKKGEC
jgi:hypothetical protein